MWLGHATVPRFLFEEVPYALPPTIDFVCVWNPSVCASTLPVCSDWIRLDAGEIGLHLLYASALSPQVMSFVGFIHVANVFVFLCLSFRGWGGWWVEQAETPDSILQLPPPASCVLSCSTTW